MELKSEIILLVWSFNTFEEAILVFEHNFFEKNFEFGSECIKTLFKETQRDIKIIAIKLHQFNDIFCWNKIPIFNVKGSFDTLFNEQNALKSI